jgi:hypothetical protein
LIYGISDGAGAAVHLFTTALIKPAINTLQCFSTVDATNLTFPFTQHVGHSLISCKNATVLVDHKDRRLKSVQVFTQRQTFPLLFIIFEAILAYPVENKVIVQRFFIIKTGTAI